MNYKNTPLRTEKSNIPKSTWKKKIGSAIKYTVSLSLASNIVAFSVTGLEKCVSDFSAEKAAKRNAMGAIPLFTDIGFVLGHNVFYDDPDYLKTAKENGGYIILPESFYIGGHKGNTLKK